ncbi:CHRD domain-containing protein [Chitinophaga sp.]|uniref:CHRD domain-containing protein n=1 Tax=Chitinophaga sp. TaxID=1869181 RepID=UPI002630E049|nr:CHRD domain-containing protein [uncultured Chitinophaga sp.]
MKNLRAWALGLLIVCCLPAVSCKKDKDDKLYTASNAPMSGGQEFPAVTTTATGNFDASYNRESKQLTITVRWQGLSGNATLAHIHGPAAKGANAGVLYNFTPILSLTPSGNFSTSFTLNGTNQLEEDLLAGKWYVNIHTANHPGGEIRGQIELTY